MAEKWEARGLAVILVHCQNVPKETVLPYLRQHGVTFSVYGGGKVKGKNFSGIPHCFVFDHKGELIFEGTYSGLDSAVEDAVKAAPDWLVGSREWDKVKPQADKIAKRRSMGRAVKDLREMVAGPKNEVEREEAQALLGRVEAHAGRLMKRADDLVAQGDPMAAQRMWKEIEKDFRGDEIADKAKAREKEMSSDPIFKKEMAAAKMFARIEMMGKRLDPPRRDQSREHWEKKNAGIIRQLLGAYKSLEKKYGDTKVCNRAKAFLQGLGIQ